MNDLHSCDPSTFNSTNCTQSNDLLDQAVQMNLNAPVNDLNQTDIHLNLLSSSFQLPSTDHFLLLSTNLKPLSIPVDAESKDFNTFQSNSTLEIDYDASNSAYYSPLKTPNSANQSILSPLRRPVQDLHLHSIGSNDALISNFNNNAFESSDHFGINQCVPNPKPRTKRPYNRKVKAGQPFTTASNEKLLKPTRTYKKRTKPIDHIANQVNDQVDQVDQIDQVEKAQAFLVNWTNRTRPLIITTHSHPRDVEEWWNEMPESETYQNKTLANRTLRWNEPIMPSLCPVNIFMVMDHIVFTLRARVFPCYCIHDTHQYYRYNSDLTNLFSGLILRAEYVKCQSQHDLSDNYRIQLVIFAPYVFTKELLDIEVSDTNSNQKKSRALMVQSRAGSIWNGASMILTSVIRTYHQHGLDEALKVFQGFKSIDRQSQAINAFTAIKCVRDDHQSLIELNDLIPVPMRKNVSQQSLGAVVECYNEWLKNHPLDEHNSMTQFPRRLLREQLDSYIQNSQLPPDQHKLVTLVSPVCTARAQYVKLSELLPNLDISTFVQKVSNGNSNKKQSLRVNRMRLNDSDSKYDSTCSSSSSAFSNTSNSSTSSTSSASSSTSALLASLSQSTTSTRFVQNNSSRYPITVYDQKPSQTNIHQPKPSKRKQLDTRSNDSNFITSSSSDSPSKRFKSNQHQNVSIEVIDDNIQSPHPASKLDTGQFIDSPDVNLDHSKSCLSSRLSQILSNSFQSAPNSTTGSNVSSIPSTSSNNQSNQLPFALLTALQTELHKALKPLHAKIDNLVSENQHLKKMIADIHAEILP